ncbi:hypothetical protein [Lysobacter tyrosinilyticus]
MKTIATVLPLSLLTMGLLFTAPAQAQKIAMKNFLPAASWATTTQYSCKDRSGKTTDAELRYGQRRNANGVGYSGELYAMTFGGKAADAATVKRVNAVVAGRTIEMISLNCQEGGAIQMHFSLWGVKAGQDQAAAEKTSITVVRKPGGQFEVL